MPSSVAHSINSLSVLEKIDSTKPAEEVINNKNFSEFLKTASIGPDALAAMDWDVFCKQHQCNVREYFELLINIVKDNNLKYNPQAIAFLYGQIIHYSLDVILHPFIYYVTCGSGTKNGLKGDYLLDWHCLFEMWMDNYAFAEFMPHSDNMAHFYKKMTLTDKKLIQSLNKLYYLIYGARHIGIKFVTGYASATILEGVQNLSIVGNPIIKNKLGDMKNDIDKVERVKMILDKNTTYHHPVTNVAQAFDFKKMWFKSVNEALEIISRINDFLYHGKSFEEIAQQLGYITDNLSYNTGCKSTKNPDDMDMKYFRNYTDNELYELFGTKKKR